MCGAEKNRRNKYTWLRKEKSATLPIEFMYDIECIMYLLLCDDT